MHIALYRRCSGVWGVLLLLWLMHLQAAAQSAVPAARASATVQPALQAFFDPTGQLGAAQVTASPAVGFAALDRAQPLQLQPGALWLRFSSSDVPAAGDWWVRLPLPSLREVEFFSRNANGELQSQKAGAALPKSAWSVRARYPVFALPSQSGPAQTFWLKISHGPAPFSSWPELVNAPRLFELNVLEHLVLGGYFGLALLVLTVALSNAQTYRDAGFGIYALYAGTFASAQLVFSGVAGLYWWPENPVLNDLQLFLRPANLACSMWFAGVVLKPQPYLPVLAKAMTGLMLLIVGLAAALLLFRNPALQQALTLASGLGLAALVLTLGSALRLKVPQARWLALGFSPLILAASLPILLSAGLITSNFWTQHAVLFASAFGMPIFVYGLLGRVSQKRSLRQRAAALSANDAMTGLSTAQAFSAQLHQTLLNSKRTAQPCAVLVVELIDGEAMLQAHGRQASDVAVVLAAACVRGAAARSDWAARLDGYRFALLLEGSVSIDAATAVATQIVASGLRTRTELGFDNGLRFKVVVGYLKGADPQRLESAPQLLARLVGAVGEMGEMGLMGERGERGEGSGKTIKVVAL